MYGTTGDRLDSAGHPRPAAARHHGRDHGRAAGRLDPVHRVRRGCSPRDRRRDPGRLDRLHPDPQGPRRHRPAGDRHGDEPGDRHPDVPHDRHVHVRGLGLPGRARRLHVQRSRRSPAPRRSCSPPRTGARRAATTSWPSSATRARPNQPLRVAVNGKLIEVFLGTDASGALNSPRPARRPSRSSTRSTPTRRPPRSSRRPPSAATRAPASSQPRARTEPLGLPQRSRERCARSVPAAPVPHRRAPRRLQGGRVPLLPAARSRVDHEPHLPGDRAPAGRELRDRPADQAAAGQRRDLHLAELQPGRRALLDVRLLGSAQDDGQLLPDHGQLRPGRARRPGAST